MRMVPPKTTNTRIDAEVCLSLPNWLSKSLQICSVMALESSQWTENLDSHTAEGFPKWHFTQPWGTVTMISCITANLSNRHLAGWKWTTWAKGPARCHVFDSTMSVWAWNLDKQKCFSNKLTSLHSPPNRLNTVIPINHPEISVSMAKWEMLHLRHRHTSGVSSSADHLGHGPLQLWPQMWLCKPQQSHQNSTNL